MKKDNFKKYQKRGRLSEKTEPARRFWNLASRSEHIKNREKRK